MALNQRFYEAFRSRDTEALDGLLATEHPVSVVHPGWRALTGRDAVLASWSAIFRNPRAPEVHCEHPAVFLMGTFAMVICTERLPEGALVATNLYAKQSDGWRLTHHHAGPGEGVLSEPEEDSEVLFH